MPITVTRDDIEAILSISIATDTWQAVETAVVRELDKALPHGLTVATVTTPRNQTIIDSVFTTVAKRVVTNPTGAVQAGAGDVSTTFAPPTPFASDPFQLRKAERRDLARCTPETSDATAITRGPHAVRVDLDW